LLKQKNDPMSVSAEMPHNHAENPARWTLPAIVAFGIVIPVFGTILIGHFFHLWMWRSLPFHSTLEVAGAVLGLVLAALILSSRQKACTSRKMLVACALASMAALDIVHSCVPISNTFVWLHSLAVLAGGLFFALVWFPEQEISMESALTVSGGMVLAATLIGVFSAMNPESIPAMVAGGHFTLTAKALNFLGGGLTLLAAVNFAFHYAKGKDREDLLFLILTLLFGLPGVLFQLSAIWEASWWFWHLIRLAGYLLAFWLALLAYRSGESKTLLAQLELDTLFNTAVDGKRLIDPHFKQVRINDTFAAMTGMDMASENQLKCYEQFPWSFCHTDQCPLKQLERGTLDKIEQEIMQTNKDGSERHYLMTAIPLVRTDGSFRGIVESFWDITKRKRAQKVLADRNVLKTALADFFNVMRGDLYPEPLCRNIITFLCKYLHAQIGLIYLAEDDGMLVLTAGYAFEKGKKTTTAYRPGEGLVGQAALDKEDKAITDVPEGHLTITSGFGHVQPRNIYLKPVVLNDRVTAVIELGTLEMLTDSHRKFLELGNDDMALAIDSAKHRKQLVGSLEESQKLSDALQAQQEALGIANQELEEQSEELRASNEELEQQSEELRASNEELEEKTEALELKKSEIEKAKGDVEEKARELELAGKYKSEFLANMSHELRTPLNSLLILAKLLSDNEEGNLNDEQVESAKIIHGSGQDLIFLINEILDLSKVEAGMMEVHAEDVPLEVIVQSLRRQFQTGAREKGLIFDINVAPDVPSTIRTDRQRLEQILRNFLSNSFKFTKEGSVTLEIRLPEKQTRFKGDQLTYANALAFSVNDTGPGIPEGKRQSIFEAFKQVDGSVSRQYGGTGLGLSISRALAHLLNGQIHLVSQVGDGSTFTLYLPLERRRETTEKAVDAPEKIDTPKRRAVRPKSSQSSNAPALQFLPDDRDHIKEGDRSVLIIEDDIQFAKILMAHARRKSFKCLAAGDGNSGLQLAADYRPSAIILDLGLPDFDGATVLDSLKYGLETRHIPVHVISGRDKTAEIMQKGAMGFLTKPIDAKAIQEAFDRIENILETTARHILVVEDDRNSRKAVEALVATEGVEITGTDRGEDALKLISENNFDCVVLDLGLPDMTGFDLLRTLNEDTDLSLPPVIIYTGKELTNIELRELSQYTSKIVIKGANSPERLLDEASLFLHTVESSLPGEQQRMLRMLHNPEQVLSGKKILLVDDDLRNSFALSKVLKKAGLKVVMAENGQVALETLDKQDDIDMVLMDIMMPVMDGHEATAQIRKQARFKDLPIVALTAKAMVEDRAKCIQAGANDYLAKPVDTAKLMSLMRVLLY
jgi:PAS domain S-box-containing protein